MEIDSGKPDLPCWSSTGDADFSDWEIDLVIPKENLTVTYSVHRYVLGSASDYFKCLFEKEKFSESKTNKSTTELHPSGIVTQTHFESMLTYVYYGHTWMDDENVVPLAYLADYFQLERLYTNAEAYFDDEVDAASCPPLYVKAVNLGGLRIKEAIARNCAHDPDCMKVDSKPDDIPFYVDFWKDVWSERMKRGIKNESKERVLNWSTSLAQFLDLCSEGIDKDQFQFFTEKEKLPVVSLDAAFLLMEQEKRLELDTKKKDRPRPRVRDDTDTKKDGTNDPIDFKAFFESAGLFDFDYPLTNLQRRCLRPILKRAYYYLHSSNAKSLLMGKLRKLNPVVLEHFVSVLMDAAKIELPPKSIEILGADEDTNGIYTWSPEYGSQQTQDGKRQMISYNKYTSSCGEYVISNCYSDKKYRLVDVSSRRQLYMETKENWEAPEEFPPMDEWEDRHGDAVPIEVIYRFTGEYDANW